MSTADVHTRTRAAGRALAAAVAIALVGVACTNGDGDQRGVAPVTTVTPASPQPSLAPSASSASGSPRTRNMDPLTPLTIESNTQATIDDVRIGVGNIWEEEYTDEAGAKKKGLTAMVQVFVKDDSAKNITKRVHPGQKLLASRFEITVEAVQENAVRLLIDEAKKP